MLSDVLGKAKILVDLDLGQLESDLRDAEHKTRRSAKTMGEDLRTVGRYLTASLTVPLAGFATFAFKMSMDFEKAFAGVRKTVDATTKEFKVLEDGIRQLSIRIPVSANELADLGKAAGQLGIQNDSLLKFVETIARLEAGSNLAGEEGARMLGKFAAQTSMSHDNFDRLGSSIAEVGRKFAATESELVNFAMRLGGAGKTVGMTEAEIMGLAGALASVGLRAEHAGSATSEIIMKLFEAVNGQSEKMQNRLENVARVAHMTGEAFKDMFKDNPVEAFRSFITGFEGLVKGGGNVVEVLKALQMNERRARDVILRMANSGELLTNTVRESNIAWEENIALLRISEIQYGTTAGQLKLLWQIFEEIARVIGDNFTDAFKEIAPELNDMALSVYDFAKGFEGVDSRIKLVIVAVGALLAAIGPLVFAFGAFVTSIGIMASFMGAGFVSAMGTAVVAVVALGAVVIAATEAWVYFEDDIRSGAAEIVSAFESMRPAIADTWNVAAAAVGGFIDYFGESLMNSRGWVVEWCEDLNHSIVLWATGLDITWKGLFDSMMTTASGFFSWIGKKFGDSGVGQYVGNWWREMKEGASALKGIVGGNEDLAGNPMPDDMKSTTTEDMISKKLKDLKNTFKDFGGDIDMITPASDKAAKALDRLREKALQLAESSSPTENLRQDLEELQKMAEKFPDIITPDIINDAMQKFFLQFDRTGQSAFADLSDATKNLNSDFAQLFDTNRVKVFEAQMEVEEYKRLEDVLQNIAQLDEQRRGQAINLQRQTHPAEDFLGQLKEAQSLMEQFPNLVDEDTMRFLAGELWQQFGDEMSEVMEMLSDDPWSDFRKGGTDAALAILDEFEGLDETTKEIVRDMGKIQMKEDAIENINDAVGALKTLSGAVGSLPKQFDGLKKAFEITTSVISTASAAMSGNIVGAVAGAVETVGQLFGLMGDDAEKELTSVDKAFEDLANAIDSWGDQFADVIVELVTTGEASISDFIESVLADILKILTKAAIVYPIEQALGVGGFAKGGAFNDGHVIPMAKGRVVTQPTIFPMADGMGLMGEAGYEAVMPLKRTSTGELGVISSGGDGGGTVVNIFDQRSGGDAVQTRETRGPRGEKTLDIIIADSLNRMSAQGKLDRIIGPAYGVERKGVKR